MTSPESQVPQPTAAAIEAALRKLNLCDPDDDTVPVFWDADEGESDGSQIRHWASVEVVAKDIAYLLRASATSAASPLIHSVTLSGTGAMGSWTAVCSCLEKSEGDLAHVEHWKDQHLADTLIPNLGREAGK